MTVSKILLMYPNFKWLKKYEARTAWHLHPYNLCMLSAMVEDKYDVKIVDANMDNLSEEQFSALIEKEKPNIVGISVLTNEYGECGLIAAKIVKAIHPQAAVVFGGVHATVNPQSVIENPEIDYVVVGEGEYAFRELCIYLDGKGPLPSKGIVYRKEGKIITTPRADFIMDLDKLPLPSYGKVDYMRYATQIQRESVDKPREMPYANVITSRGCPFNCCFCEVASISGKTARCRSPENIMTEVRWLVDTYGIRSVIFDDDNILMDKARAKRLFQMMIDSNLNLKWNAIALAAYKLDEELIELMKKSGCQYVDLAIESGVERVLKEIIHKPLNLEHAKRMVKKLKEVGIDCIVNFIVGFPGETWAEIRKTLKFADELDADYTKIFIATPLPNTELYRIAKEGGYLTKDFSFDKHLWTDGFIETDEFRPQDLKILRAYEWDRINFTDPGKKKKIAQMMGITEERIDEIRKATFRRANP